MSSSMARAMAAALATISISSLAFAGKLTTLQGKMADGTITLGGGALVVKQADGQSFNVDPADILLADLNPTHSLHRGLQLTSGEIIAVDSIQKLDDTGVHATLANGKSIVIPADRVARIIFRHIPSAMEAHLTAGEFGVILDTGDFFQGELRELNGDHARVDSVLFGIQSFDMNNQALAIVLHDTLDRGAVAQSTQIIHDTRGSVFFADKIRVTDGKLTFDDAQLGPVDLPQDQLARIDAGEKLEQSLADLKPSGARAADFKIDRTLAGVPMNLRRLNSASEQAAVQPPDQSSVRASSVQASAASRGIAQSPGTTLSWSLHGAAQSLIVTVGVPAALLPVGTVRFSILADGHELFRSRALSSVDDPQTVAVDLSGVEVLTFAVSASSKTNGLEGLWLNPQCVRR